MKDKSRVLIYVAGLILIILIVLAIILGDPMITLFGIIIGVMFILVIISLVLEYFFPKSKISKILGNIPDWIFNNIHFG